MSTASFLRALAATSVAACLLGIATNAGAAGTGDPLPMERPARQVRQPERAAILGVSRAGRRIVAVGERGIALWSDDAGRSWHQAGTPVSVTLTAVNFVDDRTGWAVGHGAVILHSADGGTTWQRQFDGNDLKRAASERLAQAAAATPAPDGAADPSLAVTKLLAEGVADKPILDVNFVDAKIGYAAGAYGLLLRTQDGGHSWQLATQKLGNPKGLHLNTVRTRGRSVLIAGEQGTAYLSIDGGDTFRSLATPYRGSYFAAAILPAGGLALAGLRGNLLVSADSGSAWTMVKLPTGAGLTVLGPAADAELRVGAQSGQIFTYRTTDHAVREWTRRGPPMMAALVELDDGAIVAGGLRGVDRLAPADAALKP